MPVLTDAQKQEVMDAIEVLYGDDREALKDALRDIIAEAGSEAVKNFLTENTRGLSPEDYSDPAIHRRIQELIKEL